MTKRILIDLHFLPSLEYFVALQGAEEIRLEKHEHYVKQSYRSRCYINTAQGVAKLTVPLSNKHGKVPYNEVTIDYTTRWQNVMWRTLESAYRNSPYFEHYSDDLHKIIYSGTNLIFDLNRQILSFCLASLHWKPTITETVVYEKVVIDSFSDIRSQIDSRNTYIGRRFFRPTPYYQVFGNRFEENLSLVDLLFCTGPQAGHVLKTSTASHME